MQLADAGLDSVQTCNPRVFSILSYQLTWLPTGRHAVDTYRTAGSVSPKRAYERILQSVRGLFMSPRTLSFFVLATLITGGRPPRTNGFNLIS